MTMKTPQAVMLALSFGLAVTAGAASAKPPLKDVAVVREGIIATGIALEISEKCGSISARRFRGINYLMSLRNHAFGLGYTSAEVDAYVNDKQEESRLKEIAYGRLAQMGAIAGNEASYCLVGRQEIGKDSAIGRLLR